jgi:hypothetical protein
MFIDVMLMHSPVKVCELLQKIKPTHAHVCMHNIRTLIHLSTYPFSQLLTHSSACSLSHCHSLLGIRMMPGVPWNVCTEPGSALFLGIQ